MVGSGNFNVGPGLGLDPIRTDILNIKYRPDRLKVGKFSRPDRPEPGFDRDSTGIRFGFPMYLGDFSKRDDVTGEMINSTLKDESPVTFSKCNGLHTPYVMDGLFLSEFTYDHHY